MALGDSAFFVVQSFSAHGLLRTSQLLKQVFYGAKQLLKLRHVVFSSQILLRIFVADLQWLEWLSEPLALHLFLLCQTVVLTLLGDCPCRSLLLLDNGRGA